MDGIMHNDLKIPNFMEPYTKTGNTVGVRIRQKQGDDIVFKAMDSVKFRDYEALAVRNGHKTEFVLPVKQRSRSNFPVVFSAEGLQLLEQFKKVWDKAGMAEEFSYAEPHYDIGQEIFVREPFQVVFDPEWECDNRPIRELISNFDSIPHKKTFNRGHEGDAYCVYRGSDIEFANADDSLRWEPSSRMTKSQASLFLKIVSFDMMRIQDMTERNYGKEGIWLPGCLLPDLQFAEDWNRKLSAKAKKTISWQHNPFVWVYEFEVCGKDQ